MTRHFTNSELSTHRDCRRKWWLSYYRRLRPAKEKVNGPMPLGTRVHYALQAIHDRNMTELTREVGPKYTPVEAYNYLAFKDMVKLNALYADLEDGVPTDIANEFNSEVELGRIMVEGYLEWLAETGADAGFDVIGTEEKVDVAFATIAGVEVRLLGKFDLRVKRKRDGARLFVDYKTCGSISQRLGGIHMETQFFMYQLLERLHGIETGQTKLTQGSMVGLLRKVKRTARANPPFYAREEVHHSDIELRAFYHRVHAQISDILKLEQDIRASETPAQIAYPSPSRDCSWKCEFRHACPMFDDGSDVERYLADNFVEYDPLTRYDDRLEKTSDE